MISLGEVTTFVVAKMAEHLGPLDVLVGDGVAPLDGGWGEGTPNTSGGFVPYVVIKANSAASNQTDVPLCSTVPVRLSIQYVMTAHHISRAAADALAETARRFLKALDGPPHHVQLGDISFRTNQVWIDSVSGAYRDDSTHPKFWSAATNFRAVVARGSA